MSHHQEATIVTTTSGQGPAGAGHVQVQQDSHDLNNGRYQEKAGRILGIIQLCLGVLSVICGGITALRLNFRAYTSFWCGCIYITAGIFGIVSPTRHTSVIVFYMMLSIIAALLAPYHIGQQLAVLTYWVYFRDWSLVFHIISALAGFIEFIIAIISAAFCCKGATCCNCCWSCCCECCCGPPAVVQTMTVQYGNQPNSNVPYGNKPSPPYDNQGFKSV